MSKGQAREEALRARRSLTPEDIRVLSHMVAKNLLVLPEYEKARVIASYVAKGDEVQTAEVLRHALTSGKRVIVPRSIPSTFKLSFHEIHGLDELSPGTFGILEPAADSKSVLLAESDFILVPVVAWDSHGNRVGYGKGYFDRELKTKGKALCAGLAFEVQLHDPLPTTPTDVPLDMVVTEKRVIRFRGGIHG